MKVEFIEYVRPNAEKIPWVLEIDDKYSSQYTAIMRAGLELTAELMSVTPGGRRVQICIDDTNRGDVLTRFFTLTGPVDQTTVEFKEAAEEMIGSFSTNLYQKWVEQFDADEAATHG